MADKPIKKLVLELELESGYSCTFKLENASYRDFLKFIFKLEGKVLGFSPDLVDWTAYPPDGDYKLQYPYYLDPLNYLDPLRYVEDK